MTTVPYGTRSSALEVLETLAARHPVPLSAVVQVTRRCNLRCRHCFQVDRSGSELTTAQWKKVFRRLADAGVLFLTLTGGEPSARKDFLDLVRIARSMSFAVKVKTNGVLVDEAACDALAAAPVMEVHLSLYSADPQLHDRVTGMPGSHARTVAVARRLRSRDVRVQLSCPLQRDTFDGYGKLIDFADAEGMDWLFDPGIEVQEDGCSGPAQHRLLPEQLEVLFGDPRLSLPVEGEDVPRKLQASVCRVGKAMVAVAPNGDVWPCLSLLDPLGNLLDSSLESIWVGNPRLERYSSLRWCDLPACRECEFMGYCVRCHANALNEDGDFRGPSRLACASAKARARIAHARSETGLAPKAESRRLPPVGPRRAAVEKPIASKGR